MSVLEELIEEIKAEGINKVASEANVAVRTLRNWLSGSNIPVLTTAELVADAMGYKLILVPKE